MDNSTSNTPRKHIITGGPAFPRPATHGKTHEDYSPDQDGMDLRDYFAAKAMQSMTAGPGARMVAERDERYDETNWAEIVASNAYMMADAMLKARRS